MVATALTPEWAIRQPRRVDGRVGLFLMLATTAGAILFWQSLSDTRGVVVATRDLPAGATLAASDLAVAPLRADDAVYGAEVPADGLGGLVGRQLASRSASSSSWSAPRSRPSRASAPTSST